MSADDMLFETIARSVYEQGYAVTTCGIPAGLTDALRARVQALHPADFRAAGTGRQQEHQQNAAIRRDKIRWLSGEHETEAAWLDFMNGMQRYLNQRLLLGLFSYESHFAHYQPGDFYRKHLDAFRGQANRILTTVFYLNPDWPADGGGELIIYNDRNQDDELLRVRPAAGTLVTFLSEEFPHEVLPAQSDRYSIAGWFRLNSSNANRADPPR